MKSKKGPDLGKVALHKHCDVRQPIEDLLLFHAQTVSNRFALHISGFYRSRFGLSVAAWRAIAMIAEHQPLSAKEISQKTVMDVFRVTRALTLLSKMKLIERTIDVDDRRRISVILTPKGRKIYEAIMPHIYESAMALQSTITPTETATLMRLLKKLEERSIKLFGTVPEGRNDGD